MKQSKKKSSQERGVAMFMAVFALMLLTAIAAGFVFMANTETSINANYRTSQQAYFAAKAGLEEARARISSVGDIVPPAVMPNTTTGEVRYIINATGSETVEPWTTTNPYFDNSLCKANYVAFGLTNTAGVACAATAPSGTTWYASSTSVLPGVGTASAFPVKWTRIALKANRSTSPIASDGTYPFAVSATASYDIPVCWDGNKQILLPTGYTNCATGPATSSPTYRPVYMLTALAVMPGTANSAGSRRLLSMEVADDPPFFSNSAINSQDYVTLKGTLTIDGYDFCSCNCPSAPDKDGNYVCTNRSGKTCDNSKFAIYSNSEVDAPAKSANVTAGTKDADGNPMPIAENQADKYDLERLIDRYKNMAEAVDTSLKTYRTPGGQTRNSSNQLCIKNADGTITSGCQEVYNYSCGGSDTDCATQAGQNFGVPPAMPPDPPDSPAAVSGTTIERQVTYVPGDLKITGGSKGNGVLVVEGNLEINGGLEFYGLIIVKGVVTFTGGGSEKTNIYGSVLAGQSALDKIDTVVGGSAAIKYNRCALENVTSPQPPRMLNTREVQF